MIKLSSPLNLSIPFNLHFTFCTFQEGREQKMAHTILLFWSLFATLQVVKCLIDSSHYKILIDQEGGDYDHWDKACRGMSGGINNKKLFIFLTSKSYK